RHHILALHWSAAFSGPRARAGCFSATDLARRHSDQPIQAAICGDAAHKRDEAEQTERRAWADDHQSHQENANCDAERAVEAAYIEIHGESLLFRNLSSTALACTPRAGSRRARRGSAILTLQPHAEHALSVQAMRPGSNVTRVAQRPLGRTPGA